jgi:hypothetical protein
LKTKKLINDGAKAVEEMLEGVLVAHGKHLFAVDGSPRSIIATNGPRPGKVGLVSSARGLPTRLPSATSLHPRRQTRFWNAPRRPAAAPAFCSCTGTMQAT